MLTGLFNISEGDVKVFGLDITKDTQEARSLIGVCPQHDVLFDLLTPEEHLNIFYEFKGGSKTGKRQEIEKLILDAGLAEKKNSMAY